MDKVNNIIPLKKEEPSVEDIVMHVWPALKKRVDVAGRAIQAKDFKEAIFQLCEISQIMHYWDHRFARQLARSNDGD